MPHLNTRIQLLNNINDIPDADFMEMVRDTYDYFTSPTARSIFVDLGAKLDAEYSTHDEKCGALCDWVKDNIQYCVDENARQEAKEVIPFEHDFEPTYRNLLMFADVATEDYNDISSGEYLSLRVITVEDRDPWVGYYCTQVHLIKNKLRSVRREMLQDPEVNDDTADNFTLISEWRKFRRDHGLYGVREIVPSNHTFVKKLQECIDHPEQDNNNMWTDITIQKYIDSSAENIKHIGQQNGQIEFENYNTEVALITARHTFNYEV